MNSPTKLTFSQSGLQDFEACPHRFELRYLQKLRWPAIESEPVEEAERLAQLGRDFHRLVQQHLIGLDEVILTDSLDGGDSDLQRWWQSYLHRRPPQLTGAEIWPELSLSAPLRNFRLPARFDALLRQPDGTFLIIDWKTSHKKPPREYLAGRMQSRVYPYALAAAGIAFNQGQPIKPEAIKTLYWYPQFPDEAEEFAYSQSLFRRDERFLSDLLEQIKHAIRRSDFPQTDNKKACTYCVYRSLCDRGIVAGLQTGQEQVEEAESVADLLSLEWDQIAEIQF